MNKFDQANPKSIEAYAQGIVGKKLRNILSETGHLKVREGSRGNFGNLLETNYFGIPQNNMSTPDFPLAKVELKSTPFKRLKNGTLTAKERLVLNQINFNQIHKETFEKSSFIEKNGYLLLVVYLYEKGVHVLDYVVQLARLWGIPEADIPIIKNDWEKIVEKIRAGKAHELSGGDTFYLEACTKAANSRDRTTQPFSVELAKPRALAFKQRYVNSMVGKIDDAAAVVSATEYRSGLTFEELIISRFKPYIGKTEAEIRSVLKLSDLGSSKDKFASLARAIMGVKKKKIEEFEKAGVVMKTIQLKASGAPKEDMSFPYFHYKEIVNEKWDIADNDEPETESEFKRMLQQRFFLVVFRCENICKKSECRTLEKVVFWTIPIEDLETEIRKVWEKTIKMIKEGQADKLPGISDSSVAHVRPHGRNAKDVDDTPLNGKLVKKCFWLNKAYMRKQLGT